MELPENIERIELHLPDGIHIFGKPENDPNKEYCIEIDLIKELQEIYDKQFNAVTNGMNDNEQRAYSLCWKNTKSILNSLLTVENENEIICIKKQIK